jgi:hypothetical protein
MFPKAFSRGPGQLRRQSGVSLKGTAAITLLPVDLCRLRVNAGLRSNEALANSAIQLFGLFRVFGEQLEESQKEHAQNQGPDLPRLEPERDATANRTTTCV